MGQAEKHVRQEHKCGHGMLMADAIIKSVHVLCARGMKHHAPAALECGGIDPMTWTIEFVLHVI